MKEIAERIKKIRLERGMTQQDLANALGLKSRSSINKIEMDTYMTLISCRDMTQKVLWNC